MAPDDVCCIQCVYVSIWMYTVASLTSLLGATYYLISRFFTYAINEYKFDKIHTIYFMEKYPPKHY